MSAKQPAVTGTGRRRLASIAKAGVAAALHCSGASRLVGARVRARLPLVVGYHRVVEDFHAHAATGMPSMLISRQTLEKQLDWIGRRFDFVGLDEVEQRVFGGRRRGRPAAALTFDDGYRDVYENAFPLLHRKGIPFAVFCITGLVGTDEIPMHDELYLYLRRARAMHLPLAGALRECLPDHKRWLFGPRHRISGKENEDALMMRTLLNMLSQEEMQGVLRTLRREIEVDPGELSEFQSMDWRMLREMRDAGVTIGSHTHSHALLTNETREKVIDEMCSARQRLRERLGLDADHFAYPDGRFNASVVREAEQCGYRFGYTTCPHVLANRPQLTISRRFLWENACMGAFGNFSPSILSCLANGIFDYATPCRINHA